MRKSRWLVEWKDSASKPAIYHCISRVVDRRYVFTEKECEAFRMFMRMYENFSGCRILSYCVMSNHFHLLLEVPAAAEGGLSDEALLRRLGALYSEAFVAGVAAELAELRKAGSADAGALAAEIHARYTYRMHDLSQFMKGLLIRFTRWFNRTHSRTGTLWEERFKSVIVESGLAARTMAAYIDLNPVRAGMVEDPADYRWSSYGEAVGGGKKGNGKKAREGLVRAWHCDGGGGFDAGKWPEVSRLYRRLMGIALGKKAENGVSVQILTESLAVDTETIAYDLTIGCQTNNHATIQLLLQMKSLIRALPEKLQSARIQTLRLELTITTQNIWEMIPVWFHPRIKHLPEKMGKKLVRLPSMGLEYLIQTKLHNQAFRMNHIHIPRSRSFHRFLFIIPLFLLSDSALSQNTDPFEVKVENTTKAESEKVDNSLELKNWISKELLITLNQKFPATIDGIDQKYLKIFELSGNNEPRVVIWRISSSDQPKNDKFYLIEREEPVNKNAQNEYKMDNFRVSPKAWFMLYQTLQEIDISTMSSAPHKPDQIATIRWIFAFSYGDHMRLIHRVAPLSNSYIEVAEKDKIVNELLLRTVGQVILSIADGCE